MRVCKATSLLKKDLFGLSDPYCRVSLCSEASTNSGANDTVLGVPAETRTIKRTLNPSWLQTFQFRVNPTRQYLLFEVFDYNKMTQDDFLGLYRFNLYTLPVNNEITQVDHAPVHDMVLKQRSRRSRVRGNLHVQFAYEPETGQGQASSAPEADPEIRENDWENLESENQPLPDGWEERVDFSGRIVYVDHINREVSLDRPAHPAALSRPRPSLADRQHSDFDGRRQISEENFEEGSVIIDEIIAEQPQNSAPPQPAPSAPSAPAAPLALPDGWEATTDFSGREVYVNHRTRTAQFEHPRQAAPAAASSSPVQRRDREENDFGFEHLSMADAGPVGQDVPTAPDSLSLASESDVAEGEESPLPAGWTKGVHPESGRSFYIDHNSRTTSWTRPKSRTDGLFAALGPLAAGWEMRYTKNGRPFFINHRTKETSWHDPRQQDPLPDGWEMRCHADGRVFYVDHSTKSTQWEDPRTTKISSGPAIEYSRDYKIKYESFKANLPKPATSTGRCDIKVKRTNILEDSFNSVMSKPKDDLLRRLWITFEGEPGLDYGGVAREWFYALSREMFNPYYGLWEYSAIDNYTLQINPNSGFCNPEHERFFHFFGRVCAMAVFHGKLVDGFFIRPFYKMILGKTITMEDMAEVDVETYNSLKYVIENDPECLCLTFSAQEDKFGEIVETAFVENGADIDVTDANKMGYIKAYINWKFADRIDKQVTAFKSGFNDVIPLSKLAVFDENELEYLMCGITQIDVEDWAEYTEFKGGYSKTHHVIVWFWKAVRSFDNEFRARLLQFVTGTSRVPMNGFRELQGSNGAQKFCIEKWGEPNSLPRAHTCFNRIDLPPYTDYHTLLQKLRVAVECTGGFDID